MWKQLLMNAEFPLLRRELTQSAGRRRTWVLRVVVLVLLIFVMLSWYSSLVQGALSMGRGSLSFLGTGSQLLAGLVMFDLWAMLLLLPALTCSAIAGERERQTLGLVLVSRMTPAGIVLEKFLARLLPMAWLLMLTGPLLGITYSMGGFSRGAISVALLVLLLAALQISSVSMFWSCLLGSSQSAFWMTYVSLIAMAAGPPLLVSVFGLRDMFPEGAVYFAGLFTSYLWSALGFHFGDSVWHLLVAGVPVIVSSGLMILVSGVAVSRYREEAPITGRRVVRGVAWVLAWLLTRPEWLLRRTVLRRSAGGAFVACASRAAEAGTVQSSQMVAAAVAGTAAAGESRVVPGEGAIAWREMSLSVLARLPGQILVVLLMLGLILWLSSEGMQIRQPGPVMVAYFLLVLIGAVSVLSTAARCVVSEREKQTLEILLTTPISNRNFLLEKSAGALRICVFMLVVCGVLQACRVMLDDRLQPWTPGSDSALAFWVRSMAYTSLHLLFCLWVGVLCSLRASSQMKAAVWSLFVILIFALGPVFVYGFLGMFWLSDNDVLLLLTVYPVGMWICCESRDLPGQDVELQFACIFLSLFFYGLLVYGLRFWALRSAGEQLQRECEGGV
ncbi:MAG: ABC transporter permease [Planctomyces sp.]